MSQLEVESTAVRGRQSASRIEERLEFLGFNGLAANFRPIMSLCPSRADGYRGVLRDLERSLRRTPDSARLHALKGKALSNLTLYPQARRALERSIALDGACAASRSWLGELHLLENRVDEAVKELDRALEIDPSCAWAYFHRSAARCVMGKSEQVDADLRHILRTSQDPEIQAAAKAFLGLLEAKGGRFGAALDHINGVRKLCPDQPWPYVLRAAVHRMNGGKPAALRDLNTALAGKAAGWIYLERSGLHEEMGRSRRAIEDLASASRIDGPSQSIILRRGRLQAARKRFDLAAGDFRRALAFGASADLRAFGLQLVEALKGSGRSETAVKILDATAREFPEDGEVLFILAQTQAGSEAFRRALSALKRESSRNKKDPRLWLLLAKAHLSVRRFAEAEAAARRALTLSPAPAEAESFLVRLLLQHGRVAEALSLAQRALESSPDSAELHCFVADALLNQARFTEAEASARRALELFSGSAAARLLLARSLLEQGRSTEAEAAARQAARLSPDSPEAHRLLVLLLLRRKRFAEAESAARRALELSPAPHDERLLIRINEEFEGWARSLMMKGQLARASEAYRRVWAARPERWELAFPLAELLLRRGRLADMSQVLREAQRKSLARSAHDAAATVGRLRLALGLCVMEKAAKLGEALLDGARSFDDINFLYRSPIFEADRFSLAGAGAPRKFELGVKTALRRFIKTHPDSPWGWYFHLVWEVIFRARFDPSVHALGIEKLKSFSAARYGWMRYQVGLDSLVRRDFGDAIAQFSIALKHSRGRDWRSRCHIGEAFLCQGDLPRALAAFRRAESEDAGMNRAHILSWKGAALLWAGEYSAALEVLDEALKMNPASLALCWKGAALVKMGRYSEALKPLDRAVADQPADIEARLWRSEALCHLKRFKEALDEAEYCQRVDANFYSDVLAGVARGALGDARGMQREFHKVPKNVIDYARMKTKPRVGGLETSIPQTLDAVLVLSRGVRRGDYETAIWMR